MTDNPEPAPTVASGDRPPERPPLVDLLAEALRLMLDRPTNRGAQIRANEALALYNDACQTPQPGGQLPSPEEVETLISDLLTAGMTRAREKRLVDMLRALSAARYVPRPGTATAPTATSAGDAP